LDHCTKATCRLKRQQLQALFQRLERARSWDCYPNPKGELDPDAIYLQAVQPGIVKRPVDFQVEILGQFGVLTVAMPAPALLSVAKLVRGDARDIEDVAWWVKERALQMDEIRVAIGSLPDLSQREAASENIVLVELIVAGERRLT